LDEGHGKVDNTCSCTATASIVAEAVTTPVGAAVVAFDAASAGCSRLLGCIFAGQITDTPKVSVVIPTAAIPNAMRGVEVS
jgi:hypothetical protein